MGNRILKRHWHKYFSDLAEFIATRSKDKSTQVGCVIVDTSTHTIEATGYNGFVSGADDTREDWHTRPKKYLVTVHAELNAICSAARKGRTLQGCVAYITHPPCAQCTASLIQAGILEIFVTQEPPEDLEARWAENYSVAEEIRQEGGIPLYYLI